MKHSTIASIQAREQAYNHNLTVGGVFHIIGAYVLMFTVMGYFFYRSILVTIIITIIAAWYAYYAILVREVNVRYYRAGLTQRNLCISTMVQALTNPHNDVRRALEVTVPRLSGEFQREMSILETAIVDGENQHDLHEIFIHLEVKYREDVTFVQFMEQVETALHQGNLDPQIFRMLRRHHNLNYRAQEKYILLRKQRRFYDFCFSGLCIALMCFMTYLPQILSIGSHGKESRAMAGNLRGTFTGNVVGWIISGLTIFFMFAILHYFLKIYYDESVTTISHH